MVYESDFYTTRRPYSRPISSSYSITERPITIPLSTIIQLRSSPPHMPYVAHKRLVTIIHTPIYSPHHNVYYAGAIVPVRVHARVRPSVLAAELKRIRDRYRPTTTSYIEHYLNSKDRIYFDDEAREIRARVDSLLRRVHVFVPRAVASDFAEEIVPERMRSGDYVRRLLSGKQNAKKDMEPVSWYEVPERGDFGNLSCVKYVAGKPQSVRRPYFKVADLRPADIKNDVNFLSYYSKNREAAANASDQPMTERELRKARALQPDWTEPVSKKESTEKERKIETKPDIKQTQKSRGSKRSPKRPTKVDEEKEEKRKEPETQLKSEVQSVKEPVAEVKVQPTIETVKQEPPKPEAPLPSPPKSEPEPEPEPEPVAPVPETNPEPEPEPVAPATPVVESKPEPEPAPEPQPEPVQESKQEPEVVPVTEVSAQNPEEISAEPEATKQEEAVSETETQDDTNVKQDKDDAIKKIETYLVKAAEEARTDEERKRIAEEERIRLELEEQKAWEALQAAQERAEHIDEIIEQERAEAIRQEEEAKAEIARIEAEKEIEEQKEVAEAHVREVQQQEEQMIVEEPSQDRRDVSDVEERLADVIGQDEQQPEETHLDCKREEHITSDHMDEEREDRPYELIDDDTRIEEEAPAEQDHNDRHDEPFVEEPDCTCGENKEEPTAGDQAGTKVEEVTSGGEESFEWPEED